MADITKNMLKTIREGVEANRHYTAKPMEEEEVKQKPSFITEAKALMDEAVKKKIVTESAADYNEGKFPINKSTPQFGDIKSKQEEQIKKTIEEDLEIDLNYYSKAKDLVLDGKIDSLNIRFQFRYRDPSGEGIYLWCKETQLTDINARNIGKIRDAYLNWKKSLIEDNDLLQKLDKAANKK